MNRDYKEPKPEFIKMIRKERMKASIILVGLADYYNENKGLSQDEMQRLIHEKNLLHISNEEFLDYRKKLITDIHYANIFLNI